MINIPSNLEKSIQLEWENNFLVELSLFDTQGLTFCSQKIGVETLQSLQHLSISYVNIDSFSQWLKLLSQHAELRQLNLTMTDLVQVPAWIKNLGHLEHLDLTANRLTELPAWMSHLKQLEL